MEVKTGVVFEGKKSVKLVFVCIFTDGVSYTPCYSKSYQDICINLSVHKKALQFAF